mmetsp:Transcript_12545/g.22757  ORF Transcript_12545/g.22757 Transcript_12545/m.22757 type:complete len:149 (+) Transcript_12545:156-602(+)
MAALKYMHIKAPRGPAEDPVSVLHAPPTNYPRKKQREAWNVPARISNWKIHVDIQFFSKSDWRPMEVDCEKTQLIPTLPPFRKVHNMLRLTGTTRSSCACSSSKTSCAAGKGTSRQEGITKFGQSSENGMIWWRNGYWYGNFYKWWKR